MFKKLREKLKATIKKFSKSVEAEAVEEVTDIPDEKESKLGFLKGLIAKKGKDIPEIPEEKPKEEVEEKPEEEPKEEAPEVEKPEVEGIEKVKLPEPEEKPEIVETKEEKPEIVKEEPVEVKVPEEPKEEPKEAPEEEKVPEQPKEEEEPPEEPKEEKVPEELKDVKKKGAFDFIKRLLPGEEELTEKEKEFEVTKKEHKEEIKEVLDEVDEQLEAVGEKLEEERPGFFTRIISKKISGEKFDELFWELEVILLENNLSVEVIEKIKDDLKRKIVDIPIPRNKILDTIEKSLKQSILDVISIDGDFLNKIEQKKPYVICFLGVNGSGKTTTIAKLAFKLQEMGKTVVLAAADTFRAAAIEQLQEHADKLGMKLIKHDYGSDPAAVAFDAIKHAESKDVDIVLIDTAGRIHSNANLLEEMKKIIRVAKPDMNIFVGESITGNDCIEQAQKFNEMVGINGIILSKADIDEKGGAAISVSYVTKRPIFFLGVGQNYKDLEEFDKDKIVKQIFE